MFNRIGKIHNARKSIISLKEHQEKAKKHLLIKKKDLEKLETDVFLLEDYLFQINIAIKKAKCGLDDLIKSKD